MARRPVWQLPIRLRSHVQIVGSPALEYWTTHRSGLEPTNEQESSASRCATVIIWKQDRSKIARVPWSFIPMKVSMDASIIYHIRVDICSWGNVPIPLTYYLT